MTRDGAIDPSRVNQCKGINGCGRDFLPTPLGRAEHDAYHLDRKRRELGLLRGDPDADGALLAAQYIAWRGYARLLEEHASDLRGKVADLKDELRDERRRFLEDIATRDDRIEELEGEVSEQVHDLQGRLL